MPKQLESAAGTLISKVFLTSLLQSTERNVKKQRLKSICKGGNPLYKKSNQIRYKTILIQCCLDEFSFERQQKSGSPVLKSIWHEILSNKINPDICKSEVIKKEKICRKTLKTCTNFTQRPLFLRYQNQITFPANVPVCKSKQTFLEII